MTNIITVIEYLEGTRGGLLDRQEYVTSAFATLQQAYAVAVAIRSSPQHLGSSHSPGHPPSGHDQAIGLISRSPASLATGHSH